MADPASESRIELTSGPIVRRAWREGVAAEVTISWKRWRDDDHPRPVFDLELRGPFGTTHGRSEHLFEALQYARWTADRSGWVVAVEGARPDSSPATEQPQGLDGSRMVRIGEDPQVVRDLFAETEPSATGSVWDQRELPDAGSRLPPARASWVVGRDFRILNADIGLDRILWDVGTPRTWTGGSDHGRSPHFVFTERMPAFAASGTTPRPTTVGEAWSRSRSVDVRVDHGLPTAYDGVLSRPLRGLPIALELAPPAPFPALDSALPDADRFAVILRARKPVHLVVLPAVSEPEHAAELLDAALSRAIFDPIVVVVAGRSLRPSVRRAIRALGRSGSSAPSVQ